MRAPRTLLVIITAGIAAAMTGCGAWSNGPTPTAFAMEAVTAVVQGVPETVLAGDTAHPLYYSSNDTPRTVACTGDCTHTWIPFLKPFASLVTPPYRQGPAGTFTWVSDADGCQAEYEGHPLYTYSGDLRLADATGDGLLGTWFVVTPSLAPAPGWVAGAARSSC